MLNLITALDDPDHKFAEAEIPIPLFVHLIQRLQREPIDEVIDLRKETE